MLGNELNNHRWHFISEITSQLEKGKARLGEESYSEFDGWDNYSDTWADGYRDRMYEAQRDLEKVIRRIISILEE